VTTVTNTLTNDSAFTKQQLMQHSLSDHTMNRSSLRATWYLL